MIRSAARLAMPALALALSGCLTHMAAREDSGSLNIRWLDDYAAGCRAAAETGRPLLVVLVAGERKDQC
jgi:hypothetical protein